MIMKGEKAVQEIIEKIKSGEYRMLAASYQPLQTRNSLGHWTTVYKYHANTIRAASRKLVRHYDETRHMGFMVFPCI